MATGLYDIGRKGFLEGSINMSSNTIKITLVDTADYTVSLSTHDFIDDVPAAARVATATFANKSTTAGVFDADDITFTSVTGDTSEALIIWQDTGNEATSRLIAYIDTYTGLPVSPNGNNISVVFDSGDNKIFKL
jgi:hypothetical protein